MVQLHAADRELVERVAREAGACAKCALRFTGERSPRGYAELQAAEAAGQAGEAGKRQKPSPCPVCLGTLQHHYMSARLEQVVQEITASGYDATEFSLSLSLPICLSLRQHALWLHLAARLPAACLSGLSPRDVVPIKQVWKYIFPDVVAERVSLTHQTGDVTDFFVELVVEWPADAAELEAMVGLFPKEYATRAKNVHVYNMGVFSRQGVERSLEGVTGAELAQHYPVPPEAPDSTFGLTVRMVRGSVFLGGRYCKYSRELPQTPWIINGVRKCETSMEEVLGGPVREFLGAAEVKFLASGREDVDVRMLGSGRPFAFEVVNPRKTVLSAEDAKLLEGIINKQHPGVRANSLRMVSKAAITRLKEGEEEKRKRYTALCVTDRPVEAEALAGLAALGKVVLQQETPIRVLHRRSNAVREKVVHSMEADTIGLSGNLFRLAVVTSAGTYVKELVHDDFRRTRPSLPDILGCRTDILALDVEEPAEPAMPEVLLCHARPEELATRRVEVPEGRAVAELLQPAAALASAPADRLVLSYQGDLLRPAAPLVVRPGGLVMITVLPPPAPAPAPAPPAMSGDEVKRFTVAFGSALKHPAFTKVVRRLAQPENMESLAAACPGLSADLVAQGFLARPELLLHLLDPDTLAKVSAEHPSILEAAHNLAAAVHEEQAAAGAGREEQPAASSGSYYLDEMSDDEAEGEEPAAGPSRAGARARSSNSFTAITPAQLAQALSAAAAGSGGGGGGGFQGVTGLGPAAPAQPASGAPSPSARITSDMFQQAMLRAMAASQQPAGSSAQGGEQDLTQQVERMREMGIVDEGLAVRALQIMGGDLQAAVDLIFSGWEGGDDSMQ